MPLSALNSFQSAYHITGRCNGAAVPADRLANQSFSVSRLPTGTLRPPIWAGTATAPNLIESRTVSGEPAQITESLTEWILKPLRRDLERFLPVLVPLTDVIV